MTNKEQLLKRYAENLASSKNRNHYLRYAKHFLDHVGGLDRTSIDNYVASLRKDYSPGTVNFTWRVIRTMYNVNKLDWPYHRGEGPVIGQREEYKPQLSGDIIEAMVAAARAGKLYPQEGCFLALSTIYGLRREEMAGLTPADVDLKNKAIYVATVKSGRQRYHLVPPEIMPYLERHDFSDRYAVATLTVMFHRILAKAGFRNLAKSMPKKQQRLGWHSIRRAVLDSLVNSGVNVLAAKSFLRWKSSADEWAMPARYFGNVVVGVKGRAPVLDEAKGDEEIFQKHPFIPLWRDDACK